MEDSLKTCSAMCKNGLDLNKDPIDQMEPTPTLTMTSDSVARQDLDLNESVNELCENDGEVKGVVGEVRKQGEIFDAVLETDSSLMSSRLSPSDERKHDMGSAVENNVAGGGDGERHGKADASKGRGRRGRKKKEVKDSGMDDASCERALISNDLISVKEELVGIKSGENMKSEEDSIDTSTKVQVDKSNAEGKDKPIKRGRGRPKLKLETSECHDDDATAYEQVEASSDQCKLKPSKRGRKRKNAECAELLNDDLVKIQKVNTKHPLGQSKRILRSGMVAVIDGKKHVYAVKDAGLSCRKTEDENDLFEEKILKSRNDDNARPIEGGKQKLKCRRGRPPKMQGRNEIPILTSSQKDKLRGPKRSINYEKADGFVRDSKHLKVNKTNPVEEDVNIGKGMAFGCEEGTDLANTEGNNEGPSDGGNKSLSRDTCHAKKSKSKGSKPVAEKFGRREQKQAVREQIINILLKVGWTIEYRPRQSKEYLDAVYVDPEGRTHWSVTLAYHKLKEKVEAGNVDEKTSAAFTPIPEELLSTLFRITKNKENKGKKKQKDVGSKMSTKLIKKKLPKKQSAKSSLGGSDCKGSVRPKTGHSSSAAVRRKKLGSNVEAGQRRKPALLARSSKGGVDSDDDDFILYDGKRTLLAWMIDLGVVQSNAHVHYTYGGRKKVKHEGKITGDGVCCCDETLNLADFESHAGSNLGQPFQNVILQSGQSLLQCLLDSWNKQKEIDQIGFHFVDTVGDDPNDDTCNICGDGGDLICCDGCPSTFHQSCLDIQKFPSGDWRCVYCSCKFCGKVAGRSSEDDIRDSVIVSELLTCHLCEGKFHLPCVPGDGALDFDSKDLSFCGNGCLKIFEGLQVLLGIRHDLDDGFSWKLLRHHDFGRDVNLTDDIQKIECNCKLAVAFSIMDECFVPIVDQRSKINIIQSVVYSCGSNFRRLNFSGFYSIILEKGDEIVSAASIRIHGNQVAEMPFIGTRYMYRRQGMCRRLLTAIEMALCSLGVEKLVIPAIQELNETWTKVFGFAPLEKSKRQEMKYVSMIVFPGTDMLQKPLSKDQFSEGQVTSTGSNADAISEVKLNQDDRGAGLPVESSFDVADGSLNDVSNCKNSSCHTSEPDAHQTETIANGSSAQTGSGTMLSIVIDEQHCARKYLHCVTGMEGKTLNSPVAPMSTIHEEKVIHSMEESKKDGSCLPNREVDCLNHDSDSLRKGCQDRNACHTPDVPAGKDSNASSEMTSDLMCDSIGSVKDTSKTSHQTEKVLGCLDLPVPNGYVCDKTSTSDLSSLNTPLASLDTSHDIMRSNITGHKEVSVGVPVLSDLDP